jgi:hypothetical protein
MNSGKIAFTLTV